MDSKAVMIRKMREDEIEQCAGVIRKGFATVAKSTDLLLKNVLQTVLL